MAITLQSVELLIVDCQLTLDSEPGTCNSQPVIAGQLIRCSTSVASNYRASCLAQSKASFVAKLNIVIEEVDESAFWLEFIIDDNLLKKQRIEPLLQEAKELTAIFMASRKTTRKLNTEDRKG